MNTESFCVVVFESTHDAIKTEKAVKTSVKVELIPTPREITASCGLSVKFAPDDIDQVRDIVKSIGTDRKRLFMLDYLSDSRKAVELGWEV